MEELELQLIEALKPVTAIIKQMGKEYGIKAYCIDWNYNTNELESIVMTGVTPNMKFDSHLENSDLYEKKVKGVRFMAFVRDNKPDQEEANVDC